MNENRLNEAVGMIDDDLVSGAMKEAPRPAGRGALRSGLVAASAAVLVFVGVLFVPLLGKGQAISVPSLSIRSRSETERSETAGSEKGTIRTDAGKMTMETQYLGWTIDQYIEESPNIFIGTCTSVSVREKGIHVGEMTFEITKVLKGSYDESVTRFEALSAAPYLAGREYMLFCGKDADVYQDCVSYGISTQIYERGSGPTLTAEGVFGLQLKTMDEAVSYVEEYVATHVMKPLPEITGDYCHSDDVFEIYEYSDFVFLVEVTEEEQPWLAYDRTPYHFDVKEELKGHLTFEEYVVAFRDSMEVGKTYLLLLRKPDEGSVFFSMSSPKSVLPEESAEAQALLKAYSKNR